MTASLITQNAPSYDNFLMAIDMRTTLQPSTKRQYKRAVERAIEAGVNLYDADELTQYASTLRTSSRTFLRGAVRAWTKRAKLAAKSKATPENFAHVQAGIMRLEAMENSIETPKHNGEKAHVWLTPAQVRTLLSSPDTDSVIGRRDKLALALMVGAGLRRDEVSRLVWKSVVKQGERVMLNVTGKGNKSRAVPISAALTRMLDAWRIETDASDNDKVLRSVRKGSERIGKSLTGAALYNIVQRYGAVLSLPELQPHDLRRTYARIGYDAGIDIGQISLLLGHANIATTQRYLGISIDTKTTISDFVPLE